MDALDYTDTQLLDFLDVLLKRQSAPATVQFLNLEGVRMYTADGGFRGVRDNIREIIADELHREPADGSKCRSCSRVLHAHHQPNCIWTIRWRNTYGGIGLPPVGMRECEVECAD